MPVQVGAVTQDPSVELVEIGVVDDADGGDFADHEPERDAEGREVVDEIRRSVNGVDDKCWLFRECLARGVGFFADEFEAGIAGLEARGYHDFDGFVGFSYEIGGCEDRLVADYFGKLKLPWFGHILFLGVVTGGEESERRTNCFSWFPRSRLRVLLKESCGLLL